MGAKEYNKIISIIRDNSFWIYGYGRLAKRFYRQVVRYGFIDNLSGFIVTDLSSVKEYFSEKPVVSLNMVEKRNWIVIATDITSAEEITHNLTKQGYHNHCTVKFSMLDLEAGPPVESEKVFSAKEFFTNNSNSIWIRAIFLAATRYVSQGINGKDIYIKLVSAWLDCGTAEKDYHRFMHTVELCEKDGYIQDYPIQILKDLYVWDGSHRIVLAQCFGNGEISADVYDINRNELEKISFRRILDLNDEKVLLNFLTEAEIEVLKSVPSKI